MKTLLLTLCIVLSAACAAQSPNTLPAVPQDEKGPGQLLTQGARQRNAGVLVMLVGGGLSYLMGSQDRDGAAEAAVAVAGIAGVAGVTLTLAGNAKSAKAGRKLKALGY